MCTQNLKFVALPVPEIMAIGVLGQLPTFTSTYRHSPPWENSIRYKPEVETVPQTGSTNNLAMETYRRNLSGYTYFFLGGDLGK